MEAMNKAFDNFLWEDWPKTDTPLGKRLLNKVNTGLNETDNRIITLNTTKLDKVDAQMLVKSISFNRSNGVFTITYFNNTTATIDTMLEKIMVNFTYSHETQQLIITLDDGTKQYVDLSALLTQYEFLDSDTIAFTLSSDGKVSAKVKEGSIEEKHLRPNYLADIKVETAKAQSSVVAAGEKAQEASDSALMAKSYSDGDTGIRVGESTDNSKYYSEQAKKYFDSLSQAGTVIGVKGNAETVYRNGNVNLTPANIGAVGKTGDTMSGKLNAYGGISLNDSTTAAELFYILGIDAFVNGGDMHYQMASQVTVGNAKLADALKYFKSTSTSAIDLSATDSNAIGYCIGSVPISSVGNDGALYEQVYNNLWVHQIFGDYRTGQLAVRGKNNGAWQSWRRILDSTNFKDYVTKSAIGLGSVDNTADANKNVNSAKLLSVQATNWRQGTDQPSTYPQGETIFFSDNPGDRFNGIQYGTIHTIKGYTNHVCIQFLYPYLNWQGEADKIFFRQAILENSNTGWRPWYEVITSKNISSQSVSKAVLAELADFATKASKDSNGDVIASTYAKKSIYEDEAINIYRRAGTTKGRGSITLGINGEASGYVSSVLGGYRNSATNDYSVVLGGSENTASGAYSTTLSGAHNTASGGYSSVLAGTYNTANNYASSVLGKHSKVLNGGGNYGTQVGDVFVIGNGVGSDIKSNAFRVTYSGYVYGTGPFNTSGADYAEYFQYADGNPDNEDRVGYFMTVADGMIKKADAGDYILGIVSGNPSVIGNADEDYYWRYERDEFNRIVMEDVPELVQKTDNEGNPVYDDETHEPVMVETGNIIKNARMKLAEDYDPSLQDTYVERKDRKEWGCVGMLGVLPVRDDGTSIPGRFCRCADGGIATLASERGFDTYMVSKRISENIVSVILK